MIGFEAGYAGSVAAIEHADNSMLGTVGDGHGEGAYSRGWLADGFGMSGVKGRNFEHRNGVATRIDGKEVLPMISMESSRVHRQFVFAIRVFWDWETHFLRYGDSALAEQSIWTCCTIHGLAEQPLTACRG